MNRFEKFFGLKGEARIRYLDGEFQVVSPGDFVELQEPYATAEISLRRYLGLKKAEGQS